MDPVSTAEYTPTCTWNPVENVLAATRKNEPVCLYSGHQLNTVTPLVTVGTSENQASQQIGQIHRLAWNVGSTIDKNVYFLRIHSLYFDLN